MIVLFAGWQDDACIGRRKQKKDLFLRTFTVAAIIRRSSLQK